MGSKQVEQTCLKRLFNLEKDSYGKVRQFIKKLSEMECVDFERPDFIFKDNDGNYIGLEHFMVDHLSQLKSNGKVASNGFRPRKKISEYIPTWSGDNAPENKEMTSVLKELGKLTSDYLTQSFAAVYGNYIASFHYSLTNHVKNIETYRNNIKNEFKVKNDRIKIGLLIEIYAEFNNLYLIDKRGTRKNSNGFIPMFAEIVKLLEAIPTKDIDFIILLMGDRKVYIVRPGHIRSDMQKQSIKIYEYASEDYAMPSFTPLFKDLKIDPTVEAKNDSFNYNFKCSFSHLDEDTILKLVFYSLYRATLAKQKGNNFACSISILRLVEVYLKYVVGWKDYIDEEENKNVKPIFIFDSIDKLKQEEDEFNKRWEIDTNLKV